MFGRRLLNDNDCTKDDKETNADLYAISMTMVTEKDNDERSSDLAYTFVKHVAFYILNCNLTRCSVRNVLVKDRKKSIQIDGKIHSIDMIRDNDYEFFFFSYKKKYFLSNSINAGENRLKFIECRWFFFFSPN